MNIIKPLTLVAVLILISSCSLLPEKMGKTEYSIKPVELTSGKIICCEAHVFNTKDYGKLVFKFKKTADGNMEVTLDESDVDASSPFLIQAENQSKLLDAIMSTIPLVKSGD